MPAYQIRFSSGLPLKEWIHQMSIRLESKIPVHLWSKVYFTKGIRILILGKALKEGMLCHIRTTDVCGNQAECEETCQPAPENKSTGMFLESQGGGPIEMYQLIGVRDHKDLANKLMDHILTRLPEASVLWEKLSEDIASEISYHLFINELCGLTDLCQKATPRNLAEELVRDPGPDEVPANT